MVATIQSAITAILRANAPFTAVVDTRFFPMVIPEKKEYPAVAYMVIQEDNDHLIEGRRSGMAKARLQFDCYAKGSSGYADAHNVADLVVAALDSFRGYQVVGSGGMQIHHILLDNKEDIYSDEPEVFGVTIDFLTMFNLGE